MEFVIAKFPVLGIISRIVRWLDIMNFKVTNFLFSELYHALHATEILVCTSSYYILKYHTCQCMTIFLKLFMYSTAANFSVLIYYVILTINMQWILSCIDFLVLLILYCKIILWVGQAVSHKNTIPQGSKIKPAATAWLTGICNRISLADMTI